MRVISGLSKGHRLKSPKGIDVRPTEDKIKESLFNIIGHIDENSLVLDLFAGSGSIGIEFLSRGAKECYLIDISPKSIATIRENLIHTKLIESAKIIKSDALRAIKLLSSKGLAFNYIYLDPPYTNRQLYFDALNALEKNSILKENGLLIIEHEKELVFEDKILNLKKIDERRYGSKTISFYQEFS